MAGLVDEAVRQVRRRDPRLRRGVRRAATARAGMRVLDGLAQRAAEGRARLPGRARGAAAAARLRRAVRRRRSRAGRWCSATTSTSDRDARATRARFRRRCSARHVRRPADRVHVVDRLRRQPARASRERGRRRALQPDRRRRRRSTAACRCSPSTTARTTSRCRSRWCARCSGSRRCEPGYPPGSVLNRNYAGLEWLDVGPLRIPVDENACALVPYRGGKGSFRYISLADVLSATRSRSMASRARSRSSAPPRPGCFDLRATPVGAAYPGVEVHANLIAGMLDRKIKAEARLRARRRGDAAAPRRPHARDLAAVPQPVPRHGGVARRAGARHRSQRRCMAPRRPQPGAAARRVAADDDRSLHPEHVLRLLRRIALQAPARPSGSASTSRPSWSTRWRATRRSTRWSRRTRTSRCSSPTSAASPAISEGLDPKALRRTSTSTSPR